MKVLAGDVKSLLDKVKTEVDDRIRAIREQAREERDAKLKKAREQAKQVRNLILKDAEIKAREESKKIIRFAEKEANELMIISKGKLEKELRDVIRGRLTEFINGKSRIAGVSYEQLVSDLVRKGEKTGLKFKKLKTKGGIVLKAKDVQLDLTLDSLMNKLRLEELE